MNKNSITIKILILSFICITLVDGQPQKLPTYVYKISENGDTPEHWWKTAVIYQIYPRSFKDSDNDGNGDLQGIIQKLDHLEDMGIDAIWLSPIYKSPQVDNGYDISDYRDIDPLYGSLDDLRQLVSEAHKVNIKVLMDYVPNHTSDKHAWFQASLQRDPKYDEYYIWKNATYVNGERRPPNNWLSCFGGSAWEWYEERQQYNFHQFAIAQPDLNYRNPTVVQEMKDVLKFWLDFGVDGFRMDAVSTLFEDILLRDEPESGIPGMNPDDHDFLNHTYTLEQPESFDMIYQWREVLDEFNTKNNTYDRIMITEGSADPDKIRLFYGNLDGSRLGAHFTFNFITFMSMLHKNYTNMDLTLSILQWENSIPKKYTSNWVLGNHDNWRVATRLGVKNIDALNIMASILPGAQVTYQGEEIGQENGEVTCDEGYDPQAIKNCSNFDKLSRDFERTPFQWDNTTNAGFNTGAKTWLPVSKEYVGTNLANQNIPDLNTHYNIYKQLIKLRQEVKSVGRLSYGSVSANIFFLFRFVDNHEYALYHNTGDLEETIVAPMIKRNMTVVVRSVNSAYAIGDTFNVSQPLKPGEAVLNKVALV